MSNENEHLAPEADVNEAPAASAEAPEELIGEPTPEQLAEDLPEDPASGS